MERRELIFILKPASVQEICSPPKVIRGFRGFEEKPNVFAGLQSER
jgi:hypothetical protein